MTDTAAPAAKPGIRVSGAFAPAAGLLGPHRAGRGVLARLAELPPDPQRARHPAGDGGQRRPRRRRDAGDHHRRHRPVGRHADDLLRRHRRRDPHLSGAAAAARPRRRHPDRHRLRLHFRLHHRQAESAALHRDARHDAHPQGPVAGRLGHQADLFQRHAGLQPRSRWARSSARSFRPCRSPMACSSSSPSP